MNFKKLLEKRNELVEKINNLFVAAEKENRALAAEEKTTYDDAMGEIKNIDETIRMYEAAKGIKGDVANTNAQSAYEQERRALAEYVRSGKLTEIRAGVNMTLGDNGAIIPTTIANKIIETVENICPIFDLSSKYNVKGSLTFPVYDETTDQVQCAYATEFKALDSHTGKFTSVSLGGYLVGALTKISRSLITNGEFDVVSYIIGKISLAIARFLEKECLTGTGTTHHDDVALFDFHAFLILRLLQTLIVIIDSNGKMTLGLFLSDDIFIEIFLDLHRLWHLLQGKLRVIALWIQYASLLHYLKCLLGALLTDKAIDTGDQQLHFILASSTEATCFLWHNVFSFFFFIPYYIYTI